MEFQETLSATRRMIVRRRRTCTCPHRALPAARPLYAERSGHYGLAPSCTQTAASRYVRLTLTLMATPLSREHLKELHCIQPIENIASILNLGILSHERAKAVRHKSVAMEEIQDRRARVTIPGTGRKLHTYANLYINGRNKMMFKLLHGPGHEQLCILRVSTDVLDLDGVIVADRNASTDLVRFAPAPGGLGNIKKELVFAQYWNHDDPIAKQRHGAIVCAELLVPDVVAPKHIKGAYVSCDESADTLLESAPDGFRVTVKPYLFFQG